MLLVIIIDSKFASSTNIEIWKTINGHVEKLKQGVFKQAGVSVDVYTRTDIKLTKGSFKSNFKLLSIVFM